MTATWQTGLGPQTDGGERGVQGDRRQRRDEADARAKIDVLNTELNKWETIKKFEDLEAPLSIDTGELTPSLKVKRKVVEDKYRDILDAMYA